LEGKSLELLGELNFLEVIVGKLDVFSFSRKDYKDTIQKLTEHITKKTKKEKELVDIFIKSSLNLSKLQSFIEKISYEGVEQVMLDAFSFIESKEGALKIDICDVEFENKKYTQIKLLSDNNPFIMDSITSIINLNKFFIENSMQPIFVSKRDKNGKLISLKDPQEYGEKEIYIFVLLGAINDEQKEALKKSILISAEESSLAVNDFKEMEKRIKSMVRKLNDPVYLEKISEKNTEDIKEFLLWLIDGNFIFLGMRSYDIEHTKDDIYIQMDKNSCLGILRKTKNSKFINKVSIKELPGNSANVIKSGNVLSIDKTNAKSNVYDSKRMDYIAVSDFDEKLNVIRRNIIIGLFTPKALKEQSSNIPFLKSKLDRILFEENIVEDSFEYRHLIDIFNTIPKDELFMTSVEDLRILLEELLTSETEEKIKVFSRQTSLVHGLYLSVVLPVKFYSQKNLEEFGRYLQDNLKTDDIEYRIITQSSRIIRIHYYLVFKKKRNELPDASKIEIDFEKIASNWDDNFKNITVEKYGHEKAAYYINKYLNCFNDEYTSKVSPEEAIFDLKYFEALLAKSKQQVAVYAQNDSLFFNIYSLYKLPLYEILPKLSNLGLDVLYEDFTNMFIDGKSVFIQRFSVDASKLDSPDKDKLFKAIESNFEAVWEKIVEDDRLNKLTAKVSMDYKYIDLLRALGNYLMQINFQIKKSSVLSVLNKYSHISSMLIELFEHKFLPDRHNEANYKVVLEDVKSALESINDIHEYRIMNSLLNIVESIVRTNFYKERKYHYISFKVDSSKIMVMPTPRPMFEVYVHSSFMEGCHLRGGKVARGGIRWSDRKDDFRLEILGLMKTQMVKNAVIVPVGSKGGFIVKVPSKDRAEAVENAKKSYRTLMRGILDVTDNFDDSNNEVFPENVVHYDAFDPYLVVAADKGTATFSDIANEISEKEYNFWLKDAFASGGKHGYDHKVIGITARGAWKCVERHFRELGKNINKETFSVVGIGDMGGDVFGNGMLYSKKTLLKSAFNHIEIFIDPNPDPEASFKERERLFKKGLSWKNYNKKLISKGGCICDRNSKSIKLTKEVKEFLKTDIDEMSGEELIKLILKADVDLLWNGGIGTYVKSTTESNEDVGDRLNDSVRIDANELRAKIVGEGGNLGFTQKARIEYAMNGGKINTDALDNSAGVDMSDHEVNLKILLNYLVKKGVLKDLDDRNSVLKLLTDEVTDRVLTHNYMQSFAVSLDEYRSKQEIDLFFELNAFLANKGILHKEDYPFPNRKELLLRKSKGAGYTRPELSVMLALNKMFIYDELLKSNVFSEDTIDQYSIMYFPPTVRKNYTQYIKEHRLRNEIAFTFMINLVVNNNGAISLLKINMLTGQDYPTIMKSMIFAYDVLDVLDLRERLFEHEESIAQQDIYNISLDIFDAINSLTINQLYLFGKSVSLDAKKEDEVKKWLGDYSKLCIENGIFKDRYNAKVEELSLKIDNKLAKDIAKVYFLDDFIPAFNIAKLLNKDLKGVVESIENVHKYFGISKILEYVKSVPISNEWDRLAQFSMIKNYTLSSVIVSTRLIKEFNGDMDLFIGSKKDEYDEYIKDLNTITGIKTINLHPTMLLYDKLQNILR